MNYVLCVTRQKSIHFLLFILNRVAGGLQSIPATVGREAGYTSNRSPV